MGGGLRSAEVFEALRCHGVESRHGVGGLSGALPPDMQAQAKSGAADFFRQLVQQGQSRGDIAPDIDPDLAAFLFNTVFSELGAYLLNRLQDEAGLADGRSLLETPEAERLFNQVLHILEAGMETISPETSQ